MNPEPQILNLATETQPAPQPENPADALLSFEHRGNGKVARLPKSVRDQLNQMLLDGVAYPEIIQRLGDAAKHLKPDNIGEWKKRGYRDWLLQQEWLDRMTSKSSFSADILSAPETSGLHEAGLRLAAAQMFDQLMRFNAVLDAPDSPDTSDKFARLVNALSRLNRAALSFKKYADIRADLKERQPRLLDPKQQIADEQCKALATLFDRCFRMPHPNPQPDVVSPTPSPDSTPLSPTTQDLIHRASPVPPKSDEGEPAAPKLHEGGPAIPPIPPSSEVLLTKEDPIIPISQTEQPIIPHPSAITPIGLGEGSGVRASSSTSSFISPRPATGPETPATNAAPNLQLSTSNLQPVPPPTDSLTRSLTNSPLLRENCPYCFTLLPPRLATGERPTQECHRCHRNVHHPRMNFEACPHCDNLAPDLLPNGQRPHPDCPHCKKPLPPPPPLPPDTLP